MIYQHTPIFQGPRLPKIVFPKYSQWQAWHVYRYGAGTPSEPPKRTQTLVNTPEKKNILFSKYRKYIKIDINSCIMHA